jgi:hypothetical protein
MGTYALLAVVVYWKVWSGHPTSDTAIGPDAALNTWFLAWAPHALLHGLNPFFSHAANAPYGINVLDNTSELLLGLLATPVTLLCGPIATFNLLMTLALAGSAASAYFLARRLTTWRPAAFSAGLLFGFSPYMIGQSTGTHLHLTFLVVPPLILLVLHEVCIRQRWRPAVGGIALAALVVAQFFIAVEVLATTALVALVLLVLACIFGRHQVRTRLPYVLKSLAVAAIVTVVVLAYPVWFLLDGPGRISGDIQLLPAAYRADLFGLFVPDLNQRLAPASAKHLADTFANSYVENGSYLGIPLVAVLLGGLALLRRRAEAWVLALGAAAMFILSLGGALAVRSSPQVNAAGAASGSVPLPERLLAKLPVFQNIIPARFSAYVALLVGLVLALTLELVATQWRTRGWRWSVAGVVGLLCFVPLIPAVPFTSIEASTIPAYFSGHDASALRGASIVLPYPSETFADTQLWQVDGRFPYRFTLAGGYFLVVRGNGNDHVAQNATLDYTRDTLAARVLVGLGQGQAPAPTAALKFELLTELRSWQVRNVVVPMAVAPNAAGSVSFLTWLLGQPTNRHADGATVWYDLFH